MRRKKWSALGISVLLVFGLAACGSSQGAQTAESGDAGAQTKASGETESTPATEEGSEVGQLPADLDFTVQRRIHVG